MKRMRALGRLCMHVALLAAVGAGAAAASDLVSITRSRFPERMWTPLTAADAALAGAGRAADPASGWSVNPALLGLESHDRLRLTGVLLDPQRSDVKANTREYSDTSPLVAFGEAGAALSRGAMAYGLYVTQDAYDQAHESFLDTAFAATQPPITRDNEFTSSLARAGLAAAYRRGRVSLGAAFELSRPLERFQTVPSAESQANPPFPQPEEVRLDGLAVGGALGVVAAPYPWLSVGAAARAAGGTDLETEDGDKSGHDEVPFSADLGVHVGRSAGGNLHLSAGYVGPRDVTLGDTLGRGDERQPERVRLAAGYAYASPILPWEFRVGLGWSPYPGDGAARYSSFGIGLGYKLEGSVVRISYARESRQTPQDDVSARAFLAIGLDVRF
jgi:hypothetical protein